MADIRLDLANAPYKMPPFVAGNVAPVYLVAQEDGKLQYNDIAADISAQTNRVLGDAPAGTAINSANMAFTCTEKIHRAKVDASEIALNGGLDKAELKAARAGKRSVMNNIELATAVAIMDTQVSTVTGIAGDPLGAIATAVANVSDYANGRVGLVMSNRVFNTIKGYAGVITRMQFTGVLPSSIRDVRSISAQMLAAALGVDEIFVGPNSAWYTGVTAKERIGVLALPDPTSDPNDEYQWARWVTYAYNTDAKLYTCESFYSNELRSNVVDTVSYSVLKVLNTECLEILDGFDAPDNAVTSP